jgi:large subunit ribosomal protein L14e
MIEIGRLCMKIAGRDAGKKCVVVDVLDKNYVLVDGEVRRKKCNMKHLEPLKETLKIKKGESHESVVKEFKKLGIQLKITKPKKAGPKPKKVRKKKEKPVEEKKPEKKETLKKEETKKEVKSEKPKK